MFVLGLLTCIVLRAFSAQAEVVETFGKCSRFFYKDTEPQGMDENAKKICQRFEITSSGVRRSTPYNSGSYATLYSVPHRIPLYSAYTLDPSCSDTAGRTDKWHLEPKISDSYSTIDYMVPENQNNQGTYKRNQAISSDYSDTGYDRGQLNPNSFSCTDNSRTATFTLTNAAPMDTCFNRIQWKKWESTLKSFLTEKLNSDRSATAYIVTGTVPDANLRIPQKEISEEPERVTVPSYIWTAVCYKHNYNNKNSFSFGYIGENLPGGNVELISVSALNRVLSHINVVKAHMLSNIKIFVDDCFEDNNKLKEVKKAFQKLISLPVTPNVQNTINALQTVRTNGEDVKVTDMSVKLTFSSSSSYSTMAEELQVSTERACLITNYGKESVECQLVPKKRNIAADGLPCSSSTKPCCSTPCLYKENLQIYWCSSGQELIACSPPYSLITYKGERCKDDHPCSKYGQDYYWCNTISGGWDYCSPPLWRSKAKNGQYCRSDHACATYGSGSRWCYTDDGTKHKCCTSDSCYSTVTDQTCKPSHPCGYHGKDYLWCYTTDGSWNYCCTRCG
ncbi:uncharacterized protein LOC125273880 [Megalobrama amblycephala]|uniref:uncharacterized protein LOC125243291 n=1 Tax=Megalobrama amblycephala TaxID=75352 RepID=UPI002013FC32|nr:uncharacterized protein LOC125243291 [Megalobrama amblycephala]XP_048008770.1 uncharacterized protein LOC125243291 [Megalobrama amblycephala]XP_048055613.1 uncharacterized protein LOC125273880 [Megalobrama amblycephala]XP_048055621.1 uncharacterized protein LOC125273880 [Megalobrama amblycephala]